MDFDFLFLAKIILFMTFWLSNLAFIVFIFKSRGFYKKFAQLELVCSSKRKEAVRYFIPLLINISEKNKKLNMLLNIKNYPLKEIIAFALSSSLPLICIFQILNGSFNLNKFIFNDSKADSD